MVKENLKENVDSERKILLDKTALDLDKVLVEEVGPFGRYQVRTLALTFLMVIFIGFDASEFLFTAARIGTRCFISECENKTEGLIFTTAWLSNAIPSADDTLSCKRFAPMNITTSDTNNICSEASFDRNTTITCKDYVYENTNTVVYDFGLACDEWRRSMIGSVRTFGTLVAQPFCGYISDRFGRRTAFAISILNAAWIGLSKYWASSYVMFLVLGFVETVFGAGVFPSLYIMMMEMVGPKYRVAVGASFSTAFATGGIILGLIAWAVPNWRTLTLVLYIPQLFAIGAYWLFSESMRWYLSNEKFEETERILKNMACVNGTELSENTLRALHQSTANEKKTQELKEKTKTSEPWLIVQVFRHKPIFIRCLVAPIWWIAFTFIYYGLTINSVNLSIGNKYTNYLAVLIFEIPGFWTATLLMDRIGRRPTLAGSYWICSLALLGFTFTPVDYPKVSLALYVLGKYSISTAATSVYLYTSELFPTKCRHTLVAFCSMTGRIGSILAPMTPALGGRLPFVLFAGLGVAAGLLVLAAPETRGCRLPDSMEEAAGIGAQRTHGKGV